MNAPFRFAGLAHGLSAPFHPATDLVIVIPAPKLARGAISRYAPSAENLKHTPGFIGGFGPAHGIFGSRAECVVVGNQQILAMGLWGPPERGRLEDVIPVVNVRKFEASTDDPRVAKEPPDLSWVSRRSDVKVLRFAAKQQVTYAPANEIRLVATAHEPGDDTQGILVNAVVRDIVCTHGLRLHIAGGLDRLGFDLAGAGLPSF